VSEEAMVRGIVLWFSREKSFGFIAAEENDLFVHRNSIADKRKFLVKGDVVEFEIGHFAGRDCAVKVHVVAAAGGQ
jgi:cold shock CspA family protein